jgi:hypothetical protein
MGQQRRRRQFHVMELFLLALLLASSAVSGSRLLEDAVDDDYEVCGAWEATPWRLQRCCCCAPARVARP